MIKYLVTLTYSQMMDVGVHLGTSLKKAKFLSFWMFYGFRNNMFILNLIRTRYLLRLALTHFNSVGSADQQVFYVNLYKKFKLITFKYAFLINAGCTLDKWVNGCLSNYEHVFIYYNYLVRLFEQYKFRLKYYQKKRIVELSSYIKDAERTPAAIFVPKAKESWNAIDESYFAFVPCAAIVDSDTFSGGVGFPIPGNDDSYVCANYYYYLITKVTLMGIIANVKMFKDIKKKKNSNIELKLLQILLFKKSKKYIINNNNMDLKNDTKEYLENNYFQRGIKTKDLIFHFKEHKKFAFISPYTITSQNFFFRDTIDKFPDSIEYINLFKFRKTVFDYQLAKDNVFLKNRDSFKDYATFQLF